MSESILRPVDDPSMSNLRPILVPVDFSSCSRAALIWAGRLAGFAGVPLLILHVIHETGGQPGFYRKNGSAAMLRPIDDIARDMLHDFIEDVYCDTLQEPVAGIRTMLVSGLPASRITEIAVQEEAALIVVGTHGRVGLSRLTMGSVAAEVMMRSAVPVTVVKVARDGEQDEVVSLHSSDWWQRAQTRAGRQGAEFSEPLAG